MSSTDPAFDDEYDADTGEVGVAQDLSTSGALIMAEVADPGLAQQLDEREDGIGERKEMGPDISWDDADDEGGAASLGGASDADEETPVPLADDG